MRPSVSTIAAWLALILTGISTADETVPSNLRVCVQLIEVPHSILTEMMAGKQPDGESLHKQAMARVKSGGAKLVDSNMVTTRGGQKATLESIQEIVYPSEIQPAMGICGLAAMSGMSLPPLPKPARNLRFIPPYFKTHNTGVNLDVEPYLSEGEASIELRVETETDTRIREYSPLNYGPEWGGGPVRIPIFEAWRSSTSVNLMAGKFECISVITPKDKAPAPAVTRKILVFVRADIVPVFHKP